jgi:hypothetical protein
LQAVSVHPFAPPRYRDGMTLRILAVCLLAACGTNAAHGADGGEPADLDVISSEPAHGIIAGKSFTLGTRYMNISDGDLWVNLLADTVADCTKDQTNGSYPMVAFFTKPMPGRYTLDFATQTVSFFDRPSSTLVVTSGVLQIDAITDTQVTGGLHVWNFEEGEINGRFDGKLCYSN